MAAAIVIGLSTSASAQDSSRTVINVLVYDFAAVPGDPLRGARDKVTRIYRDAGVDIVWIDPRSEGAATPIQTLSNPAGPFTVRLMIRPKRHWGHTSNSDSVMGDALPADTCAGSVSLFYEQVLKVTGVYRQPIADILALAMAHEIGHVLLPPPGHSTSGIMRATWDGDDIRRAVLGRLTFTSAESSLIRMKLAGCRSD